MADRRNQGRDRRIIERFSDSRVRDGMMQIRFWIRIVFGILVAIAMVRLSYGVYRGVQYVTHAIFDGTFLAIYASTIYQYDRSIGIYLENESVNNFEKTVDRQRTIWMVFSILSALYLLVSIILKM
ncbi:MAG: hypothetical protein H6624_06935 [Bdellovibrionaceae bacterium]|nr:hypothetical protein [Bdellovibrionales bacterium]MCB9084061.1 hypothetical protein [Pseudobdellovibrionaceae bacterium]